MSQEFRWLLPEGINEVVPPHGAYLEEARRRILDLFSSWGYELVVPPLVEYLDSLLTGTGSDVDLQTFKVTDQLTGRLMGIRADMTPQAARIDAHCLKRDCPTRLCYLGPVLHALPSSFAGSRNPFQVGAELYGHRGIESDAEILCLMLETLRVVDAPPVYVDLGHMRIFKDLARTAGLDDTRSSLLFDMLQRKARPEMEEWLREWQIPTPLMAVFLGLTELNGDDAVLADARQLFATHGQLSQHDAALTDLERLSDLVRHRVSNVSLHFDLAEIGGYHYYTGATFAAYVTSQGQAVAKGGRYDDIGRVFGRARAATGFSTDLKRLIDLSALLPPISDAIIAPWPDDALLREKITELRSAGQRVICELPGTVLDPAVARCDRRIEWLDGRWSVVRI
jgi:ATP phosphoribosyltransferase regulatory subunit